ncbi:aldose 1-epimerase family protein [Leifsonia poae]|uniref:aldose epimerase family protein n=1 Tax=Leifsonia poae TaxID=110933 RepID=UPI003D6707EE
MTVETVVAGPALVRIADPTGRAHAAISPRAASLRALTVGGIDIVEPSVTAPGIPGMSGATLAPWPNRVEGARWWHNGLEQRLEVTEPELGHANHGLLADADFELAVNGGDTATLSTSIRKPPGYPFDLDIAVRYTMDDAGVAVTTTVTNRGEDPAPVALGAHPYLRIGSTAVADLAVSVQATHAYRLDGGHIPRERFPVSGTDWDLRAPRPLKDAPDHATFEDEAASGMLVHSLRSARGPRVDLWAEDVYRWTQLYIDRQFPSDDGPHTAVAIEPMTAPPNALRSGEGIRWLEASECWSASWGIRLVVE